MVEHLKFTNERLTDLLTYFKGREVNKDYSRSSEIGYDRYEGNEDMMKKAAEVLQLTKTISITELDENKAVDKDQLDIIVMIIKMNENMENILREAGAQPPVTNIKSESTFTLVNVDNSDAIDIPTTSVNVHVSATNESDTLKRDNKLKMILDSTKQKVDDLSEYLKERDDDLKERGEIITNFYKEFEDIKERNNSDVSTVERILLEYAKSKTILEEENDFLLLFVEEVREELLNLEKGYKMEEETQMHLQDFVNELQVNKRSLEQNVDKITTELQTVKRDKDYLLQSISLADMINEYQDPCVGDPYPGGSMLHQNVHRMYDNQYYADCGYCAQNSESSVLPFSDEECPSAVSCDDCDSIISDQEMFEIICSPDSTTCSKLAYNIKTSEATEKIKSKNHPLSNLEKEIKTWRPSLLSPRNSRENSYATSVPCIATLDTSTSTVNKETRVLGRRDSIKNGSHGSNNNFRSNPDLYFHESGSITSQDSTTRTTGNLKLKKSYVDITAIHEYSILDDESNWNGTDVSPFLNPKFDSNKKRKKKFMLFGKKWQK